MAISFRNFKSAGVTGSTTLTIDKPVGTVDGDMMIAIVTGDRSNPWTTLSGWTVVESGAVGGTMNTKAMYKEASSEGASYTFTFGISSNLVGQIITIQNTGGTWDAPTLQSSMVHADPNTVLVTGSVTAALNDLLIASWSSDGGRAISSAPSGMTATEYTTASSLGISGYHLASLSAGAVTKSLTFDTSDQMTAFAVIISDDGAGGDETLTGDPGALIFTGAAAAVAQALASSPGTLLLTGSEAALALAERLQSDPNTLQLTGADAALALGLVTSPGALLFTGAEATLIETTAGAVIGDPGALLFTGAAATFSLVSPIFWIAEPAPLTLTGAEATLTEGAPALVVRKGGVRWLVEPDPEIREEKVKELTQLIKPAISAQQRPDEPQVALLGMVANATSKMTRSQQTRTDRLLQQTGITLEELLILLQ